MTKNNMPKRSFMPNLALEYIRYPILRKLQGQMPAFKQLYGECMIASSLTKSVKPSLKRVSGGWLFNKLLQNHPYPDFSLQ